MIRQRFIRTTHDELGERDRVRTSHQTRHVHAFETELALNSDSARRASARTCLRLRREEFRVLAVDSSIMTAPSTGGSFLPP